MALVSIFHTKNEDETGSKHDRTASLPTNRDMQMLHTKISSRTRRMNPSEKKEKVLQKSLGPIASFSSFCYINTFIQQF